MDNASASMAKRFQLLFVLPRSVYSIIISCLSLTFVISLVYEFCYGLGVISSVMASIATIAIQAIALQINKAASFHLSAVATTRRLAASLTVVNVISLVVTVLSLLVRGFNPIGGSYAAAFVPFVSMAFGILIFWPVFTRNAWTAIAFSAINTTPLIFLVSLLAILSGLYLNATSLFLGLAFIIVMLLTLRWINSIARRSLTTPSFALLKAFLEAWTNLNGAPLEKMLSNYDEDGSVSTFLIEFDTSKTKAGLIIPEVHPGPFAPVGAFDLPGKLYSYFRGRGYDEACVLHGAVDHSLNLVSFNDVEQYLSQLTIPPIGSTFSPKISAPLSRHSGAAITTGLRFGDSLCIFVSVPKGSEDYPSGFREAVRNICAKAGYRRVIVVDAHNSIGESPSEALQADALEGVKQVASELFSAPQFEFSLGFANRQFSFPSISNADIGAGGISCVVFRIDNSNYALVSADSNNSLVGLREQIETSLKSVSIRLLEFCTSDSHFNAARIRNRRGYLVLGETTPPSELVNTILELSNEASGRLERASLGLYEWVSKVKLPKADLLGRMETTLTDALGATKKGLAIIFFLLFAELAAMLVF